MHAGWYIRYPLMVVIVVGVPVLFAVIVSIIARRIFGEAQLARPPKKADDIKKAKWLLGCMSRKTFNDVAFNLYCIFICYAVCGIASCVATVTATQGDFLGELLYDFPVGIFSSLLAAALFGLPALAIGFLLKFIYAPILKRAGYFKDAEFFKAVDKYWVSIDSEESARRKRIEEERRRIEEEHRREEEKEQREHQQFLRYLATHPDEDAALTERIRKRLSGEGRGEKSDDEKWREIDDMRIAQQISQSGPPSSDM